MSIIEVEHLHKSYGALDVLRDLSLNVAEGDIYALLGSHGAGKSTLLHVLLGFLRPSSGKLRVLGHSNTSAVRHRIGYVPERVAYHTRFSAREYLRFLGRLNISDGARLRRAVERQLSEVGLNSVADHKLATYSRSMLQRVGIAQALLAEPSLLLLDEPLSLLNAAEQREVLDVLMRLREQGYTMFIASSYTDALATLCDRVGVLANGALTAETNVRNLRGPVGSILIQVDYLKPVLQTQIKSLSSSISCQEQTVVIEDNSQQLQNRVLRALLDDEVTILALEPLAHPLEQFYLRASRSAGQPIQSFDEPVSAANMAQRAPQPFERSGDVAVPDPEHDSLLDSLLLGEGHSERNRTRRDD
jgi:ABC-2 type transport system ATP-binding protein